MENLPTLNEGSLACKIYVETELPMRDIAGELAKSLQGSLSHSTAASEVSFVSGEIEIRRNNNADVAQATQFPDGFLFFRYAIEQYGVLNEVRNEQINATAKILERLWSLEIPAVAACDYEEELPHKGGYKSSSIPWPAAEPQKRYATKEQTG